LAGINIPELVISEGALNEMVGIRAIVPDRIINFRKHAVEIFKKQGGRISIYQRRGGTVSVDLHPAEECIAIGGLETRKNAMGDHPFLAHRTDCRNLQGASEMKIAGPKKAMATAITCIPMGVPGGG